MVTVMMQCVPRSNDSIEDVSTENIRLVMEYLGDVVKSDPSNSKAYFRIAMLQKENQNPEKALQAIDRAIQIEYADPKYFLTKGDILTDLGNAQEAIEWLLKAEAAGDKNRDLYRLLAQNYLKMDRPDMARNAVDRLLRIDDRDLSHVLAGKAYLELGDTTLAINQFKQAILRNADNISAHSGLADIYEAQGDLKTAEEELDIALALENGNLLFLRKKGELLSARQSYDSALQLYKNIAALQPEHKSYLDLATIFYRMGHFDSTLLTLDQPLLNDHYYEEVLLLKARAKNEVRDYSEAILLYSQILEKDSTHNLATTELDKLRRKVSYLQRQEQRRRALDSVVNNPPPSLNRKGIEN